MKITIKFAVVTIFIISTILTAIVAISLQYYFGHIQAEKAARDLYTSSATNITMQIRDIRENLFNVIDLLVENPSLKDPSKLNEQLQFFATVIRQNPLISSLLLGREDGSMSQLLNLSYGDGTRETFNASPEDQWILINVDENNDNRQRNTVYTDGAFVPTSNSTENTDFNVLTLPWYIDGMSSNRTQSGEPYLFSTLQEPGITISKRIEGTGIVLGIDITLSTISKVLAQQEFPKQGRLFMYSEDGKVTASNEEEATQEAWNALFSETDDEEMLSEVDKSFVNIAQNPDLQEQLLTLTLQGENYFVYVAPLSVFDENSDYLAIVVPKNEVMGTFLNQLKLSIILTFAFLTLLIPLAWLFASPIVKPIKLLTAQNDRVRKRDYDKIKRVDTYIREVDELSESMVNMVVAIQAHEVAQRNLMDSFIKLIADAIDDKSPYTGAHCLRVPELAFMLAESASNSDLPAFKDFVLENEEQWREYRIAAWLHDCGKITTPEHIVDKGSKLEAIYNRIHEIRMRFEVLWRDAEIYYLKQLQKSPDNEKEFAAELKQKSQQLQDNFAFIAACNLGGEFFDQEQVDRLIEISKNTWQRNFDDQLGLSSVEKQRYSDKKTELPITEQLLSDKGEHIIEHNLPTQYPSALGIKMDIPEHLSNLGEIHNLCISRGTLTAEDRFRINEHMISTIKMLEALPFPKELANVPRYASTHHETMIGTGYPRKLSEDNLSIPERILAVADIFEALTASDRPYKKAKPISVAINILHNMAQDRHIDMDCFKLFIQQKIYLQYAHEYLKPAQIDEVDEERYL